MLWKEKMRPLIVCEFVADDGAHAHDQTPLSGGRWLYEQLIQARYYVVFAFDTARLDVLRLSEHGYTPLSMNMRGRVALAEIGVELGIWRGYYRNQKRAWLRWWDQQGDLLLTPPERLEQERRLVEQEQLRTERLAALLRSLSSGAEQEQ
jgi:hypothetical protein